MALELVLALVIARSVVLGVAAVAAVGLLALAAPMLGTRTGTRAIGVALVLITLLLPWSVALTYRVPVGGGGIFITDILLALLLLSWLLAVLGSGGVSLARSPASLPLVLFLGWIAAEAILGFMAGNDGKLVLQDVRSLLYWTVFFWALSTLDDRRSIMLMLKVLAVAIVAEFGIGLILSAMGKGTSTGFVQQGVSRFPAMNEFFLMAVVLAIVFIVVWPRDRFRSRVLWVVLGVGLLGLALSLVRGYFVAFVVCLVFLLFALRTPQRARLLAGILVVTVLLGGALAVVRPAVFASVISRAAAVTAVYDRNVQYRLQEDKALIAAIKEKPLLGWGLGAVYYPDFSAYGVPVQPESYAHNNYLWMMQRIGVVGLALFAWVMVAFLSRGIRQGLLAARRDPFLGGLVFGVRALFVGLLVLSLSSPQFTPTPANVLAVALLMGLSEAARALLQAEEAVAEATGSRARESRPVPVPDEGTTAGLRRGAHPSL